jgi:hypothetical protein
MGIFVAVTVDFFLRLDVAPLQVRLRRSAISASWRRGYGLSPRASSS